MYETTFPGLDRANQATKIFIEEGITLVSFNKAVELIGPRAALVLANYITLQELGATDVRYPMDPTLPQKAEQKLLEKGIIAFSKEEAK